MAGYNKHLGYVGTSVPPYRPGQLLVFQGDEHSPIRGMVVEVVSIDDEMDGDSDWPFTVKVIDQNLSDLAIEQGYYVGLEFQDYEYSEDTESDENGDGRRYLPAIQVPKFTSVEEAQQWMMTL